MSASDLKGKVVVITGATTGIGEATAVEFAKHGAKLVLCGRNLEGLQGTKAQCVLQGLDDKHVAIVTGDLCEESTLDAIVKTCLDCFGQVDVLYLNALKIHSKDGPVTSPDSIEALDYFYQMVIKSPYKLTQKLSAELIKSKGVILFTSSVTSEQVIYPGITASSMMKAAQNQMARLFALTFANKGVRVNSIRPGYVPSNVGSETGGHSPEVVGPVMARLTPLGSTVVGAEEIARVAVFLASSQSACITGGDITADRGISLTHPAVDWKQF